MILSNRNEELSIELGRLKRAHEETQKQLNTVSEAKSALERLKWTEIDIVSMNLEQSRREIVELKRERDLLCADLESSKAPDSISNSSGIADLEGELLNLRCQLDQVQKQHDAALSQKVAGVSGTSPSLTSYRMQILQRWHKNWEHCQIWSSPYAS